METTTRTAKPVKGLSVTLIVIGVLMLVMGFVMYGVVGAELSSQGITVSTKTKDDPGALAGKPLNGPFEALAQIEAIQTHLTASTGGKTYAELGNVATNDGRTYSTNVTTANSTDGQTHNAGDPLSDADAKTYAARTMAQTAADLQSSLFLSILAFGVSAFIAVMGVVVCLIGITTYMVAKRLVGPKTVPPTTV